VKPEDTKACIDEIARLATTEPAFEFVKQLKEYFRPEEIVLILKAAKASEVLR
jgi:hypothetical protein